MQLCTLQLHFNDNHNQVLILPSTYSSPITDTKNNDSDV